MDYLNFNEYYIISYDYFNYHLNDDLNYYSNANLNIIDHSI